jgi:hypothetical protein
VVSAYHAELYVFNKPVLGTACSALGATYIATIDTLVPDQNNLVSLDVVRGRWVEQKTVYNFNQGIFQDASLDRGSVVKSVATLPIDVLKAIFSIPTQLIQFRINHDTAAAARATEQTALLDALAKLHAAQNPSAAPPATTTPPPPPSLSSSP